MVCCFPLRINNRPLAYFHDAVTGQEANFASGIYEFDMCPLITVMVNVIRDLCQQHTLRFQNPISLAQKGGERMREGVVILLRGTDYKTKACVEILGSVSPLIWNVRRIVDNHIEGLAAKWHGRIVRD